MVDCRVSGADRRFIHEQVSTEFRMVNPHFQPNVENSLGIGLPGTTGGTSKPAPATRASTGYTLPLARWHWSKVGYGKD